MSGAHGALQKKLLFVTFSSLKNPLFWPKTGGNFPINTAILIHNLLFRTGLVQDESDSRSQGGVMFSPIFSRVCFYLFVSCL